MGKKYFFAQVSYDFIFVSDHFFLTRESLCAISFFSMISSWQDIYGLRLSTYLLAFQVEIKLTIFNSWLLQLFWYNCTNVGLLCGVELPQISSTQLLLPVTPIQNILVGILSFSSELLALIILVLYYTMHVMWLINT